MKNPNILLDIFTNNYLMPLEYKGNYYKTATN